MTNFSIGPSKAAFETNRVEMAVVAGLCAAREDRDACARLLDALHVDLATGRPLTLAEMCLVPGSAPEDEFCRAWSEAASKTKGDWS